MEYEWTCEIVVGEGVKIVPKIHVFIFTLVFRGRVFVYVGESYLNLVSRGEEGTLSNYYHFVEAMSTKR